MEVPKIDDPQFIQLHKLVGSKLTASYIKVETAYEAKENYCFQIVQDYVIKYGGKLMCGWQIWKTNFMIEAEYHAIWENIDGHKKDVSNKPNAMNEILFIEDPRIDYDGKARDSIRLNTTSNSVVENFIELNRALFRLKNRGELIYYTGNLKDVMDQDEFNYILNLEQLKTFFV